MRPFIRKPSFYAGIFWLLLTLVQLVLHVYQPYSMVGFRIHAEEEKGYEIIEILSGGPADEAGFSEGDVIVYMNGQNMPDFVKSYVKGKDFDETYAQTPYLFEKGNSYECVLSDGTIKTFEIPEKAPFLYELSLMDRDNIINFITGGFFILLGIVITCVSAESEGFADFVWFLYATGVCIINSYSESCNMDLYSRLNIILYNFSCAGIALALFRIIGYFYRILGKDKHSKTISSIGIFPVIVIALEFLFVFTGLTPFYSPFGLGTPNLFGSVALVTSLVYSLWIFFRLLKEIPRQSSLFLRFFLMGICIGAFPALGVIFLRTVTSDFAAGVNETLYTILPLLCIPISVFCSVFQTMKPKFDQLAARIMAAMSTVVILVLVSLIFPSDNVRLIVFVCFSPFVYLVVERPVISFLYPKLDYVHRDFNALEKSVFNCTKEQDAYEAVAKWLFTTVNARFVVFVSKRPTKEFLFDSILCEQKQNDSVDISCLESMMNDRLNDRVHRDGLLLHQGRGCSYPMYESHVVTGYIFIGSRSAYDQFSNMEMKLLDPMVRILMEAMMMLRLREQAAHVNDMQNRVVFSFADMIESRDGSTGLHVKRTSHIVDLMTKKLRERGIYNDLLDSDEYEMISLAAPLHDIGKIKIPDAILSKPAKLTDEEFAIIRTHPVEGEKIIRKTMSKIEDDNYLAIARDMALYHHEKWDGTGYPEGRKGNEIPVSARIMAVADVFDALCSARSYKNAFSIDEAFRIFDESSGTHFEPVLVDVLKELRPELEQTYLNQLQ